MQNNLLFFLFTSKFQFKIGKMWLFLILNYIKHTFGFYAVKVGKQAIHSIDKLLVLDGA